MVGEGVSARTVTFRRAWPNPSWKADFSAGESEMIQAYMLVRTNVKETLTALKA